ncbi:MAG: S8 family serine peptidase [Thermoleophilia bacterium]
MSAPCAAEVTERRIVWRHRRPVDRPRAGAPRIAVERVERPEGSLLIVPGEILVAAADAEKAGRLLESRYRPARPRGIDLPEDPQEQPREKRRAAAPSRTRRRRRVTAPGFVRFIGNEPGTALLATVADLRRRGVTAGPNLVMAMGIRAKGETTPEAAKRLAPQPPPDTGASAHVVVVDTGVDAAIGGRGDRLLDRIAVDPANVDPLNTINAGENHRAPGGAPYLDDGAGHGTFVAGVVRQQAPGARVTMLRALDSDGICATDVLAAAITAAGSLGADVLNLSLGGPSDDGAAPPMLEAAIAALPSQVVVVAAAGNEGDTVKMFPAAIGGVVSVAGLSWDGQGAKWSTHGDWVAVSTYGEAVVSTFVAGVENPELDPANETFTGTEPLATWVGTSFAAPRIAGLIAAGMDPGVGARASYGALLATGTDIRDYGTAIL